MLHTVLSHCDLDLWHQFLKNRNPNISPTLFEVTISNFVCGCIWVLEIVAYFFLAAVTLTTNPSCINIVYKYLLF